jgi:hypothetical protein
LSFPVLFCFFRCRNPVTPLLLPLLSPSFHSKWTNLPTQARTEHTSKRKLLLSPSLFLVLSSWLLDSASPFFVCVSRSFLISISMFNERLYIFPMKLQLFTAVVRLWEK